MLRVSWYLSNAIHSAINQQIALKTIRKLGFKVSAVWNGKEALDYLLAAQSPTSTHRLPDIILMDVQMPIIDGYRATHLIRHHAPYAACARQIPIVAMTASAIQGDREKCQKAGMDDYLAKPVKGKLLERMLVRWATQKRSAGVVAQSHSSGSECVEGSPHEYELSTDHFVDDGASPKVAESKKDIRHMILPTAENEGERAMRREEAEDKAVSLRDDKLIVAAGGVRDGFVPQITERTGQALTVENIGKLEREDRSGRKGKSYDATVAMDRSESGSMDVGGRSATPVTRTADQASQLMANSASGEREDRGPARPVVGRRWHDSEKTVTGR